MFMFQTDRMIICSGKEIAFFMAGEDTGQSSTNSNPKHKVKMAGTLNNKSIPSYYS
jgi:hypothetical protein